MRTSRRRRGCETVEDENCDGVGPCDGEPTGSWPFRGEGGQVFTRVAVVENTEDGRVSLILAAATTGSFNVGTITVPHVEGEDEDALVLRVDAETMEPAWMVSISGKGQQSIRELAVTPSGDVLVVGRFTQALRVPNFSGVYSGKVGSYALKISGADGAMVWPEPVRAEDNEAFLLTVTAKGEHALVGGYQNAASPLGCVTEHQGSSDGLVAVLDGTTGTCTWSRRFGDGGAQTVRGISLAGDGSIYLSGNFDGDLELGVTADTLRQYVARLAADGGLLWARTPIATGLCDGDRPCETEVVAVEGEGVLVRANFNGTLEGPCELPGWVGGDGDFNLALLHYGADGALKMCRMIGGPGPQEGRKLTVDASGDAVLVGEFRGEFSPGAGKTLFGGSGWSREMFVYKAGRTGAEVWPTRATEQSGAQSALGAATDRRGNVYVVGYFTEQLSLKGAASPWLLEAESESEEGFLLRLRP